MLWHNYCRIQNVIVERHQRQIFIHVYNCIMEKGHEIISCSCWMRFGVAVGDVDGSLHDLSTMHS